MVLEEDLGGQGEGRRQRPLARRRVKRSMGAARGARRSAAGSEPPVPSSGGMSAADLPGDPQAGTSLGETTSIPEGTSKSRRAPGDGYFKEYKSGHWRLTKRHPKYGRITVTKVGKKVASLAAAKVAWDQEVARRNADDAARGHPLTVDEAVRKYLVAKAREVKGTSVRVYRGHLDPFCNAVVDGRRFGDFPLSSATKDDALAAAKGLEGRWGPLTMHYAKVTVASFFKEAVRRGWLPKSPVEGWTGKPPEPTADPTCLTEEEGERLLAVVHLLGPKFEALFRELLTTGERLGEVLAHKRTDIILGRREGPVMKVERTISRDEDGKVIIGDSPKTPRGRRLVPLVPCTLQAVLRVPGTSEFLYTGRWPDKPMTETTVRKYFIMLLRLAGLDPMRVHDLRHTVATRMLEQKISSKTIANQLGDTETTVIKTYAHETVRMRAEAREMLGSVFGQVTHILSPSEEMVALPVRELLRPGERMVVAPKKLAAARLLVASGMLVPEVAAVLEVPTYDLSGALKGRGGDGGVSWVEAG